MIILKEGKLIESGSPEYIYANPSHIYTAKLLGNAFVLSAAEAKVLGMKTKMNSVMIYPEWVQLKSGWSSKTYVVKEIFFKGFYEDLLLERNGIELIAINMKPGSYKKGDRVQVILNNYLEF
jgi:ABC-type glutathione transport system ATPase component